MNHAGPDAEAAAGAGGSNGRSRWADSGLVTRIAFAAIAVAIGLAIVFAVLFLAILSLHQRSLDARRSQQVIATANELQTLVVDLETGMRGFAITRKNTYLEPWTRFRPRGDLERAYPIAYRLGVLCRGLTWALIVSAIPRPLREQEQDAVPERMRMLLEVYAA